MNLSILSHRLVNDKNQPERLVTCDIVLGKYPASLDVVRSYKTDKKDDNGKAIYNDFRHTQVDPGTDGKVTLFGVSVKSGRNGCYCQHDTKLPRTVQDELMRRLVEVHGYQLPGVVARQAA